MGWRRDRQPVRATLKASSPHSIYRLLPPPGHALIRHHHDVGYIENGGDECGR